MPELHLQRGSDEGLLRVRPQEGRQMQAPVHGRSECGWYLDWPPQLLWAPGLFSLNHPRVLGVLGVLGVVPRVLGVVPRVPRVFESEGQWGALRCLAVCRCSTRDQVLDVALPSVPRRLGLLLNVLVASDPPAHRLRGVSGPYYRPWPLLRVSLTPGAASGGSRPLVRRTQARRSQRVVVGLAWSQWSPGY